MKRFITNGCFVVVLDLVILFSGCASHYYKVTDQSGTVYYTQELDNLTSGAVKLRDARSGFFVTIHPSEVKKISTDEYKAGLASQAAEPVATPAPSSAPSGS